MRYVLAFVALVMFSVAGCGTIQDHHDKHHDGHGESSSEVDLSEEGCGSGGN